MRRRVWTTVVVTTATLLLASSAVSAWPTMAGLVGQIQNLPSTVVVLSTVSCVLWLVSLVKLNRTWVVRRNLVRVLARFGTSSSTIANTANLSQDAVAFLTASSTGNGSPHQREVFAGSGNEYIPLQALHQAGTQLVNSTLAET